MSQTTVRKRDVLSSHARQEIDSWLDKYPPNQRQSAVLAALREVQHENGGSLSRELMDGVAEYIGIPEIAVYEVATFYSMFELQPVGRHCIAVCTNISCMLCGGEDILAHIENKLGIKVGQSTEDGKFFLKQEEECLAACCGAPMMQVNHVYHESLTPDKVDAILDSLE